MRQLRNFIAKGMIATAVAIILLHTLVPHHHHELDDVRACCGYHHATCMERHHHGSTNPHPYHACKLQQVLSQLALSDQEDRILILYCQPASHPDLSTPERLLERQYSVPQVALPTAISLAANGLRGPPAV